MEVLVMAKSEKKKKDDALAFQEIREFLSPIFDGVNLQLTEIRNSLSSLTGQLFNRMTGVEGKVATLEARQVGNENCIQRQTTCHAIMDAKIEKIIGSHPDILWIINRRRIFERIMTGVTILGFVAAASWFLMMFKIHP
jgi:hypothetical protein